MEIITSVVELIFYGLIIVLWLYIYFFPTCICIKSLLKFRTEKLSIKFYLFILLFVTSLISPILYFIDRENSVLPAIIVFLICFFSIKDKSLGINIKSGVTYFKK